MDLDPQREAAFLRHCGRSVLLVEGSRMFSTAIRFRLESELGVQVTHCADMASLRSVLDGEAANFALAVVDITLPGAADCEALDHLLRCDIPPIVFTGSFGEEMRRRVLARDVLALIVKDSAAGIQQIVSTVDRTLAGNRAGILVLEAAPAENSLVSLLRRRRFTALAACDGAGVLELLDTQRDIDVVVIDLDHADGDGLLLLSEIRRRHSDIGVRVVGLCGRDDDTALRFLRTGGDECIRMPCCPEELACRLLRLASTQKRFQALNLLASRDYLTEVYNRRYFFVAGKRLVDQAVRRGAQAAIALVDIDHFKRLNDTYGHEVGDCVLKAVSRQLRARLGDRHLLARLGGEEFGILFSGLDLAASVATCDALRAELAAAPIEADGEPVTITVSMGIAAIEGQEAFDNHVNAADQYLYMAKHAGRNQVFSEMSLPRALAG